MKLLYSLFLLFTMAFVSADSATQTSKDSEPLTFRNNAMDAIDNPYCRLLFKRYLSKKSPKAFIYVPKRKDKTAYCNMALKKSDDANTKMLIKRCERKKKKSKKNKFIASCKIFARNNNLLLTRTDFGLKPNAKDIFYIAERYGVDELKAVMQTEVDINQKNVLGNTPLLIATQENNLEMVKYLILAGANLKLKNNTGDDALLIATRENYIETFKYLLSQGADITAATATTKWQPIHVAARYGFLGIIEVLLNKGVDIDQKSELRQTPLQLAIQSHYKPVVKYVVEKGADINAKDESGKSPLDYAKKIQEQQNN